MNLLLTDGIVAFDVTFLFQEALKAIAKNLEKVENEVINCSELEWFHPPSLFSSIENINNLRILMECTPSKIGIKTKEIHNIVNQMDICDKMQKLCVKKEVIKNGI